MPKFCGLILCLLFVCFSAFGGEGCGSGNGVDPSASAFVAAKGREPFHRPSCTSAQKIAARNLESFETYDAAIAAGHRPCKVCKPSR